MSNLENEIKKFKAAEGMSNLGIEQVKLLVSLNDKGHLNTDRLALSLARCLVSLYDDYTLLIAERDQAIADVKKLREHLKYFTDRVENGSIRSQTTYKRFQEALQTTKHYDE